MNQSNNWPVAKSITFITAPACWPSKSGAEYGAPFGYENGGPYVPCTTRPACVPGVDAVICDENVTDPPAGGTGNEALLVAMYLRWSYTLKSAEVRNGASWIEKAPPANERVSPGATAMSPSPYGLLHLAL